VSPTAEIVTEASGVGSVVTVVPGLVEVVPAIELVTCDSVVVTCARVVDWEAQAASTREPKANDARAMPAFERAGAVRLDAIA